MKVNGTNNVHMNPYQKQVQKQSAISKTNQTEDKLEISSKAQEMLKGNAIQEERQKEVQRIKQDVQSGNYQINHKETAQKMLNFWSNRG
ncbi:flagellar biosynthesis anti-sigma factor FlgM [Salinibacillus xinjiangensis]|uniref:Negative regulator of flagellin synthesis n=1 Tax=Salinibacillus xinjiangensis TaxID=1229268 RepID=A0A6G1X1T2_9BACI|nr:flagellar biosynthesis anti-sigma factor FlgM [Salinibacillus xinjiangensis]MRG84788.1 flagellar biosynthesis anti-sigma factor FlgM [Salinibacillus xinjiangensis]